MALEIDVSIYYHMINYNNNYTGIINSYTDIYNDNYLNN